MDVIGTVNPLDVIHSLTHSFEWMIPEIPKANSYKISKGFRKMQHPSNTIVISPRFITLYSNNKVQWCLKLDLIHCQNYEISLKCLDDITIKTTVVISFGDKQVSCKRLTFENEGFVSVHDTSEVEEIFSVNTGHSLKILCKITFEPEPFNENHSLKGLQDFENLLESGDLSDVTFVIDGKEIHAHKAILSSRSPVFQAMFHHDMMEKQKNVVKIEDVNYEVMKELFRYIYACKVKGIEKKAMDLLAVADRYSIPDLHKLCETALVDGLKDMNIDNAIENLIIATAYDVPKFKSKVVKFVICNLKNITKTAQFNLLSTEILRNLLDVIGGLKIDTSSLS